MNSTLRDKVAVITGGGSGIGRATALAMAEAGAKVAIGNRSEDRGNAVVAEIEKAGGSAIFQKTDVTQPDQVQDLVKRTVRDFGRLDLAFNNAGYEGDQVPLHEQDIDRSSYLFKVNIDGVFYSMKYEIEAMLSNAGGVIVNNSSIFGLNAYAGWSLYAATKHAVTGMTKGAALDYAEKNIRVNAVAPGPIETELLARGADGDPQAYASFVPMNRIGQPGEIANAVVWLCSDAASFVTGITVPIDGGACAQ